MTAQFDYELPMSCLSNVMMERLRARIARRPGRWRKRMRRHRDDRQGDESPETRRAA